MAYSTYEEFRASVQLLIVGDDLAGAIEGVTSLDTMISLGEASVHYGGVFAADGRRLGALRASSMESPLAEVVAANACPIPADCMELSIIWIDGGVPLEIVAENDLRSRLKYFNGGPARKAAQAGDSIIFSPIVEDGTAVAGRYYAKPPALKEGLHPTFLRYPELYLYAALVNSTPFFGQESRTGLWLERYTQLLDQANAQERQRVSAGGRLRQVSR
ncbi:phage adaptor protein [Luteimonas sp. RIT-PG2_3]